VWPALHSHLSTEDSRDNREEKIFGFVKSQWKEVQPSFPAEECDVMSFKFAHPLSAHAATCLPCQRLTIQGQKSAVSCSVEM